VQEKAKKATPLAIVKTVLSAFFGVRRRAEYEKDAVRLTLPQVVVAGIIGGAVFVLSLVMLVRFITR